MKTLNEWLTSERYSEAQFIIEERVHKTGDIHMIKLIDGDIHAIIGMNYALNNSPDSYVQFTFFYEDLIHVSYNIYLGDELMYERTRSFYYALQFIQA